jgi:hypothetical protein
LRLLNAYRNATEYLDAILAEMQAKYDRLESLSASTRTGSAAPAVADQMAETVCELQDLVVDMLDAIDAKVEAKRHTLNLIWLVRYKQDGQWEKVLTLRYVERLSWRDIGRDMGKDKHTVSRWHDNAVGVIDGLLLQSAPPDAKVRYGV